jgi:hypothetical protein
MMTKKKKKSTYEEFLTANGINDKADSMYHPVQRSAASWFCERKLTEVIKATNEESKRGREVIPYHRRLKAERVYSISIMVY